MSSRQRKLYAAVTDVGRVRSHNEDAILAQPPLFVVADGLGGHEAGEVASSVAVQTVRDHAPRRADASALARAVRAGNRSVMRAAREGMGRMGMGTTITAAIVEGTHIALAHVGDSRAYLLHGGQLVRLTQDHSMVADMIRRGELTEAQARVHPNRSIITRALGTDANMEADTYDYDVEPGDRLLLCSDGLTGMLEDQQIASLLAAYRDPEVTGKALIAAANDAGGGDNISVVIVDIEETGPNVRGAIARASRNSSADRTHREHGESGGPGVGRVLLSVLAWLVALSLIVGGIGYGVYRYAQTRYFLIAENGGISTYRGVPGEFAGITLRWPLGSYDIAVSTLPPAMQQRLADGVLADSPGALDRLLTEYESSASSSQDSSTTTDAPSVP